MAAVNPPSRQNAVAVPAAFGPSGPFTAIKILRPFLDGWHVYDADGPVKWRTAEEYEELVDCTFEDLIRSWPRSETEQLTLFDCHLRMVALLRDFADRLEPRRGEEEWAHLAAMFDRLLALPSLQVHSSTLTPPNAGKSLRTIRHENVLDGRSPYADVCAGQSTLANVSAFDKPREKPRFWRFVGTDINSVDPRLLDDLEEAVLELKRLTEVNTPRKFESPTAPIPVGRGAGDGQGEADVKQSKGKNADHLEGRVARLESKIKKPLRSDQVFVQQRLKFCCPKRTKAHPDSWHEIYDAYNQKFPKDTKASAGSLRLTHTRLCPKCKKPSGH